jgi:hypothetical protein
MKRIGTPTLLVRRFLLIIVTVFLFTTCGIAESSAESSKEYASMALETWTSFECAVLAEKGKNSEEQERLFWFGYNQGKKFLSALKAGKVKREDIAEVPVGVLLLLQGPTADFILGRVYEHASDAALETVYKTGDKINSDEVQQIIADREFMKRNCKLIGKSR